jgi:pimeloyl-ACP methyl ester carboxylesterase
MNFDLRFRIPFPSAWAVFLLAIYGNLSGIADEAEIEIRQTPDGVEYGLWGNLESRNAPTIFILAGEIEKTLGSSYYRQCGNELTQLGYRCVSLDLPAHGNRSHDATKSGLAGWRLLADEGVDFVAANNARLSSVLDHLIDTGLTNPEFVSACGTSRGGFLAIHFAAHDSRIRAVAAFAPVTDPAQLNEFAGASENPLVRKISLEQKAEELAGRGVWLVIGDQDERVNTRSAIQFASAVSAAAADKKIDSRLELHIMPEPGGHKTPAGSAGRAAEWIHNQLSPPTPPKERNDGTAGTLLFVDDHEVLYRSGTVRVFHPASLHSGNPVIKEDRPWEMAIGWCSILRQPETGKYRLWYQAYAGGRDSRKTRKCVVCYAESEDGFTFSKPELGLHDFHSERDGRGLLTNTNIVLLGNDGYGDRYANSVLYEPHDPDPARRYKMLYTDFSKDESGREWPAFHAAFSSDGLVWTNAPENPLLRTAYGGRALQPPFVDEDIYSEVWDERKKFTRKTWRIPLSLSDTADVFFDPVRKVYAVYGKTWLQGPNGGLAWKHGMARSESSDFLHWSKPQILATPDDHDDRHLEFHTSPVFFHQGVYFCLNQIMRARGERVGAKADLMHVELMISRDGLRWERPFRDTPFFASSDQPFSSGGIFTNSTPVILDDEIRFYYGAYHSGATGGGKGLTDPSQQSGIGVATIPLDRFAGIKPLAISDQSTLKKPLEHIGQVTLKPRRWRDLHSLSINARVDPGGSLHAEILNEDGYRIRGFSKEDAIPLTGDSLHHEVSWKSKTVAELPPGSYSLRVHLNRAELFAISVQ